MLFTCEMWQLKSEDWSLNFGPEMTSLVAFVQSYHSGTFIVLGLSVTILQLHDPSNIVIGKNKRHH